MRYLTIGALPNDIHLVINALCDRGVRLELIDWCLGLAQAQETLLKRSIMTSCVRETLERRLFQPTSRLDESRIRTSIPRYFREVPGSEC